MKNDKKSVEAVLTQAIDDLIVSDAVPLLDRYVSGYSAAHGRHPSRREENKAARRIIDELIDSGSYTWRLLRVR